MDILTSTFLRKGRNALKLNELLQYTDIVIQCHDNPDADAVASGYGVYKYLHSAGAKPRLIYGGKFEIKKPNMKLMIDKLNIPIEYVTLLDYEPELLLTVDCLYGEGNVQKFPAKNVAVIDHHTFNKPQPLFSEIRSNYGSCASVVAKMLLDEGFDYNSDRELATALYYGLFMDTGGFSQIGHPADRDLRDNAKFSESIMNLLCNSNFSQEDMKLAGNALLNCEYDLTCKNALSMVEPCDPNILGFIGDMIIQVYNVDTCAVFCRMGSNFKLSVRSCTPKIKAPEFARYLTLGDGGGHNTKAGGRIAADKTGDDHMEFFRQRVIDYHKNTDIIYAGKTVVDTSDMRRYVKKDIVVGYIHSIDIVDAGKEISIRMLEGDITIKSDENIYIMIGVEGEVYPIDRAKFESSYRNCTAIPDMNYEYSPTVIDKENSIIKPLNCYINGCIASHCSTILARKLTKNTKVFLSWDEENYSLGNEGDFLAVRADDPKDVYIIKKEIFAKTYDPCDK